MREPSQRYVRRRTRESLRARQLDRRHPQPLDVARMPDRAHRDAVVNLEKLLPRFPQRQEQNSVPVSDRDDRATRRDLRLDLSRAVRDRFDPTIRLFDHATLRLNTAAIRFSGNVVMPSRETTLMIGKIFALRSTPPVAVSDSAAVSSARSATVTASSSVNFASVFFPQLFS